MKVRQASFLTQALGGPAIYKGRDMKSAHEKHLIEKAHFDRVAYYLIETLKSLNVPQNLIDEIIAILTPLSEEIVNTQG